MCAECRRGPSFRLDLIRVNGLIYKCRRCETLWRATGWTAVHEKKEGQARSLPKIKKNAEDVRM